MKTFKELVLDEGTKAEYQAFFNKKLKKFGVKSKGEGYDPTTKEFYNEIDKEWKGDNEKD